MQGTGEEGGVVDSDKARNTHQALSDKFALPTYIHGRCGCACSFEGLCWASEPVDVGLTKRIYKMAQSKDQPSFSLTGVTIVIQ